MPARSKDAQLLFVGTGNQSLRLLVAAKAHGVSDVVRFVPGVSYREIPFVYAAADIVVAPSLPTPYWEEQFGMVLAEAMASGRALLSTTAGAIPEVVGDAGVLVPPYDSEALSEALKTLLHDSRERFALGSAARERAHRLFSVRESPLNSPTATSAFFRHDSRILVRWHLQKNLRAILSTSLPSAGLPSTNPVSSPATWSGVHCGPSLALSPACLSPSPPIWWLPVP